DGARVPPNGRDAVPCRHADRGPRAGRHRPEGGASAGARGVRRTRAVARCSARRVPRPVLRPARPGRALRRTLTTPCARLHGGVGRDARVGHRRHDGDFFGRRRGAAAPLPYADPNGLVMLWEHHMSNAGSAHNVTGPANFLDWRDEARSFSAMAAFVTSRVTIVAAGGDPVSEQSRYANAALLPMLGIKPVLGRLYTEAEDRAGAARVAVLDYGLWQRRFGSRRAIVGSTVQINGNDVTIVGVLPKGFAFFEPSALWMPMRFSDADRTAQGRYLRVVARLKPGVSWQQADLEMKAIARRRAVDVPELDANWTALASPMRDDLVGNSRTPLLVLL